MTSRATSKPLTSRSASATSYGPYPRQSPTSSTPRSPPPPPRAPSTQTDIHIDSLVADAEYTPAGLAVASSTITQGSAVLHVAGAFKPRTVYKKRVATYVWDDGTSLDIKVQLANANVVDVLTIAGQQQKIPLTGTIATDAHVSGTVKALSGAGTVSLVNGVAYGEPYESANVALSVQGQQIEASQVTLKLHGYTIAGNGGYNMTTEAVHAHIAGPEPAAFQVQDRPGCQRQRRRHAVHRRRRQRHA